MSASNGSVKQNFQVSYVSSEDPGYPASELNVHGPKTLGWQSLKFCDYPQELGFMLLDGEKSLSQVQLLSHQSKIASRIEIFIGCGSTYATATFERLGFMTLDVNERSNLTARELKTVYIENKIAQFLKLIIHRPHSNTQNLFSQVGIIAVNALGCDRPLFEEPSPAPSESKQQPTGSNKLIKNASKAIQNYVSEIREQAAALSDGSNLSNLFSLDPQTSKRLKYLAEAKAQSILAEDFDRAKAIKLLEADCRRQGSKLTQLDSAKAEAVLCEDFDLAKDFKLEADDIRKKMDIRIAELFSGRTVDRNDDGTIVLPSSRPPSQPIVAESKSELAENMRDLKAADEKDDKDEQLAVSPSGQLISVPALALSPSGNLILTEPEMLDLPAAVEEIAPPPEHPLEGVPDCLILPQPEELADDSFDLAQHSGLLLLLGEYRAGCFFSKIWALREAALVKVRLMMQPDSSFISALDGGVEGCIAELAMMIRIGCEDRSHQVVQKSVALLEDILLYLRGIHLPRNVLLPFIEPIITILIDKLSDGNHMFRNSARRGLDCMAAAEVVGPGVVVSHTLKPLPEKYKNKNAWRPIVSRLGLLADYIGQYGFSGGVGYTPDGIMGYMKSTAAFSHAHAEVRDAARELTVAVHALIGESPIEMYLQLLRPKQLDEYRLAFAKAAEMAKLHDVKKVHVDHHDLSPRSKRRQQGNQKVNTAASRAEAKALYNEDDGSDQQAIEFTRCTFCGVGGGDWTEESLDLHYWKDCPVLAPCPTCAQVVEVAGLPEHLLNECEYRAAFVHCPVTGLAIRQAEYASWQVGPHCRPPPHEHFYCPLCLELCHDSDDAWRTHVMFRCSSNPRGSYSPAKGVANAHGHGNGHGQTRHGHDHKGSPSSVEQPHWYAL